MVKGVLMHSQVHKSLIATNVRWNGARDGVEVDHPSEAIDCVEVYHQANTPISEQESNICSRGSEMLIFGHNVAHYGEVSTS